jgi:beta-lactamase regulating signal transducer with metallopeptidase domain
MSPNILAIELKGILIVTAAWLLTLLLRKSSAAKRHLVWLVALVAVAIVPLAQINLPSVTLPVNAPAQLTPFVQNFTAEAAPPKPTRTILAGITIRQFRRSQSDPVATAVRPNTFTLLWIGLSTFLIIWLLAGLVRARRILKAGKYAWNYSSPIRVPLLLCQRLRTPATVGFLKPAILLPADAPQWPEEKLKMCIAHEEAHVRRLDWLWQTGAALVCALFPFNPLLWLAAKKLREESELACDDLVLEQGFSSTGYAETLLEIARSRTGTLTLAGAVNMARTKKVESRIRSIVDPTRQRSKLKGGVLVAALVAGVAAAITLGSLSLRTRQIHVAKSPTNLHFAKAKGQVIDPQGNPVEGATIFALKNTEQSSEEFAAMSKTDDQGNFDVSSTPLGKEERLQMVVAYKPGYAINYERLDKLKDPVVLTLKAGVSSQAKLIGPDGKPAANGEAYLTLLVTKNANPDSGGDLFTFLKIPNELQAIYGKAVSDSNGTITFSDLPQGTTVGWELKDDRYAAIGVTNRLNTSKSDMSVVELKPAAEIEGTITCEGKPASGVQVGAQGTKDDRLAVGGQAFTNSKGHYIMRKVEAGTYNIALDQHTFPSLEWTATAYEKIKVSPGQKLQGKNFQLIHGGIIEGKVNADPESLKTGVLIGIYSAAHPYSSAWVQDAKVRSDGTYLAHVPAGPAKVYISSLPGPMSVVMKDVIVEDGKSARVDF